MVPLLSGLQVVMTAARAQEGARAIAREVARGETADAATARVTAGLPGSSARIESVAGDAVVTVTVPVVLPFGTSLDVTRTARTAQEQP
jgi:predicted kinase